MPYFDIPTHSFTSFCYCPKQFQVHSLEYHAKEANILYQGETTLNFHAKIRIRNTLKSGATLHLLCSYHFFQKGFISCLHSSLFWLFELVQKAVGLIKIHDHGISRLFHVQLLRWHIVCITFVGLFILAIPGYQFMHIPRDSLGQLPSSMLTYQTTPRILTIMNLICLWSQPTSS